MKILYLEEFEIYYPVIHGDRKNSLKHTIPSCLRPAVVFLEQYSFILALYIEEGKRIAMFLLHDHLGLVGISEQGMKFEVEKDVSAPP